MRSFHDELCKAYEDAQEELQHQRNEKSGRERDKEEEIDQLKQKF